MSTPRNERYRLGEEPSSARFLASVPTRDRSLRLDLQQQVVLDVRINGGCFFDKEKGK